MTTAIKDCRFTYRCPRTWEQLAETNVEPVRYCGECDRNVYRVSTADELAARAGAGECVAIPIEVQRAPGLVSGGPSLAVGQVPPPPYPYDVRNAESHQGFDLPFVGIDGCSDGWFYFSIEPGSDFRFGVLQEFADVEALLANAELVLVDIPIGLPSERIPDRRVDAEARRLIRPRGSSVFNVPVRSALAMPDYRKGLAENRRCTGKGFSIQGWSIAPKILEVDSFMRQRHPGNVREMHPEVAFWGLNGGQPMQHNKKRAEGRRERLDVLSRFESGCEIWFEFARSSFRKNAVADDDIIDAMVGAVTASRADHLCTVPEEPLQDEEGLPMEMVYAQP